MAPHLPPFGIRGLCSPETPFSVLQVTESQYDSSIRSWPASALTWLDDDDGETITIGSARELSDRLNEPTPCGAPFVTYRDADTRQLQDRYIHLFDVSKSQIGRDLWREHEAYYSKTQIPDKETQEGIETDDAQDVEVEESGNSSDKAESTQAVADQIVNDEERSTDKVNKVFDDDTISQKIPDLVECLGDQLEHIATFLQGTSDILRKAADKTRDADTTAVEDVLTGMTHILGEVSAFGLEVFGGIGSVRDLPEANAADDVDNKVDEKDQYQPDASVEEDLQKLSFTERGDVDMTECRVTVRTPDVPCASLHASEGLDKPKTSEALVDSDYAVTQETFSTSRPSPMNPTCEDDSDIEETTTFEDAVPDMGFNESMLPPTTNFTYYQPFMLNPTLNSILDQDAEDADFAARYPPLMTLRKAKTTSDLRDEGRNVHSIDDLYLDKANTQRPSPQVFDAETQRRKNYALACFPSQKYQPDDTNNSFDRKHFHQSLMAKISSTRPLSSDISIGSKSAGAGLHSEVSIANTPRTASEDVLGSDQVSTSGAWSNYKTEDLHAPVQESSGEFFNRMVGQSRLRNDGAGMLDHPTSATEYIKRASSLFGHHDDVAQNSWNRPHDSSTNTSQHQPQGSAMVGQSSVSSRFTGNDLSNTTSSDTFVPDASTLSRHRSLMMSERASKITNGVSRSRTVNSANPAARLNRPFNPMLPPAFSSEDQTIQPGPQSKQSNSGPIRSLHRSSTERRPRSLYEPYRSFSTHRSFSPVWEDHLSHITEKKADIKAKVRGNDPVTLYAWNFAPENSEQDIKALLEGPCEEILGSDGLQQCSIIARDPYIAARLVVRNSAMADELIATFNNSTHAGRVLSVGYDLVKSVRAAHKARRKEKMSSRTPHRMRSMPTFTETAKHDTFTSVAPAGIPSVVPQTVTPRPPSLSAVIPILPAQTHPYINDSINQCEHQLVQMGYGLNDPAVLSRLHIYAAAANGDIEEAIQMIEDDKKAHESVVYLTQFDGDVEDEWWRSSGGD